MAAMLEKAGIIEELFDAVYKWLGAGEGRACGRDRARLHGARRDGRRRRRDRSHHGHDRAARHAQARLRPEARLRLAARRRHARHPDSAVGDGDRLRGGGAAIARRIAGRLDLPGLAAVRPLHRLHPHPLLHQSEPRPRAAARGARQHAREIPAAQEHHRADPADRPGARRDLRRHRDAGRGRRHRHLRRAVRLRAAPPPQLAGGPGSRDRDAEGDRDGDVDLLRRHDVRRLLHREGRADVRRQHDPRHRPCRPTAS